ncbi:glycerate kinase family protein [Bacilliculturomica massiliensis]|uniref:glycerate kinase family protein n=1 Tax=Bacilliculturomica massiliensis TaxID=1917867 RepID=UPI0010301230|nr:glycerate kinase [Bacilliculturomica massiliensis]
MYQLVITVSVGSENTVISGAYSKTLTAAVVTGPMGTPVRARFAILPGMIGVVELAEASGLTLSGGGAQDVLRSTTRGTGELIDAVIKLGCRKVIVGLGGSATNDGGAGILQALGVKLTDAGGVEVGNGGGELERIAAADFTQVDEIYSEVELIAACDVNNPLCGPNGASAVFGPQKGAQPADVQRLDRGLLHYAELLESNMGMSVLDVPGMGAAGGAAVALAALFKAELRSGIDIILDLCRFGDQLERSDFVVTGEGRVDFQSAGGKVISGVAARAGRKGVPVIVIAGAIGPGAEKLYEIGVSALVGIADKPMTIEESMERAEELIAASAEGVARLVQLGLSRKGPTD